MSDGMMDLAIVGFAVMALVFAYGNTRKDGDGFVAVVSLIVAGVALGWV